MEGCHRAQALSEGFPRRRCARCRVPRARHDDLADRRRFWCSPDDPHEVARPIAAEKTASETSAQSADRWAESAPRAATPLWNCPPVCCKRPSLTDGRRPPARSCALRSSPGSSGPDTDAAGKTAWAVERLSSLRPMTTKTLALAAWLTPVTYDAADPSEMSRCARGVFSSSGAVSKTQSRVSPGTGSQRAGSGDFLRNLGSPDGTLRRRPTPSLRRMRHGDARHPRRARLPRMRAVRTGRTES